VWVDYNTGEAVCDREGNPTDEQALALAQTQAQQGEVVKTMEHGAVRAKEEGSGLDGVGTAPEAMEIQKPTVGANVMTKDTSGMSFTVKGKARSQQVQEMTLLSRFADVHMSGLRWTSWY
jgi:hypothetical protein